MTLMLWRNGSKGLRICENPKSLPTVVGVHRSIVAPCGM